MVLHNLVFYNKACKWDTIAYNCVALTTMMSEIGEIFLQCSHNSGKVYFAKDINQEGFKSAIS